MNRRTRVVRWAKFNLVGAGGMVLQLGALAVMARIFPTHPLGATAAAVEITLLHNFCWHLHYTWRDRHGGSMLAQCTRFHLSNGLASMVGNLALMRLLIQTARLPLLVSNGIAILCCSIVNFFLSDSWVFFTATTTRRASS